MEDWAEIRRLHRSEKVPIKEIARRLGIARNTVRSALTSDAPPEYQRALKGSIVDAVEPQIRGLLAEFPRMPATVIAERIGWERSLTVLKERVRELRPLFLEADPVDKLVHHPGQTTQCDLWFPEPRIPVGGGQVAMLPVLVMSVAFSKVIAAQMIPSRTAGDILAGMWSIIHSLGAVTKTLWWDRESAIGGRGRPSPPAAAFAGTLGTRIVLAPPRDPETKGMVERTNGYLETSFLPGRAFTSPQDFNAQLGAWLPRANQRMVRSLAPAPGAGARRSAGRRAGTGSRGDDGAAAGGADDRGPVPDPVGQGVLRARRDLRLLRRSPRDRQVRRHHRLSRAGPGHLRGQGRGAA